MKYLKHPVIDILLYEIYLVPNIKKQLQFCLNFQRDHWTWDLSDFPKIELSQEGFPWSRRMHACSVVYTDRQTASTAGLRVRLSINTDPPWIKTVKLKIVLTKRNLYSVVVYKRQRLALEAVSKGPMLILEKLQMGRMLSLGLIDFPEWATVWTDRLIDENMTLKTHQGQRGIDQVLMEV